LVSKTGPHSSAESFPSPLVSRAAKAAGAAIDSRDESQTVVRTRRAITVPVWGNRSLWSRLSIGTGRFRAATKGSGYFLTSP
jgi:hypothetical protein